jgi:hypothetical protein
MFTRYFAARALATMGRMAMPFYILHEGHTAALSGATLGILTFAFTLSGTFSNLIWGPLGDRTLLLTALAEAFARWTGSRRLLVGLEHRHRLAGSSLDVPGIGLDDAIGRVPGVPVQIPRGVGVVARQDHRLIGSNDVRHFDSPPPDEKPQLFTYTIPFTVPPNVTRAGLHVQWPQAAGNQSVAEMRTESGGAQYGLCFDNHGRKFVCSNSSHIRAVMYEDRYAARNPHLAIPSLVQHVGKASTWGGSYHSAPDFDSRFKTGHIGGAAIEYSPLGRL